MVHRTVTLCIALILGLGLAACGSSTSSGSGTPPVIDATYVELTGMPDPMTVFDTVDRTFLYTNNLTGGIWHHNSDQIIVGYYTQEGYWSHPADMGGWTSVPDNDTTGTNYIRMVQCPRNNLVVYGTSVLSDPAAVQSINADALRVAAIDRTTGVLSPGVAATFSDNYTGNASLLSSSATDLYILQDATTVRRYATAEGSADLQFVELITLSQALPSSAGVVAPHGTWCGQFAWDGVYFYFAVATAGTASPLDYAVYEGDGTYVGTYTAAGTGQIHGVYFDWSVGRYATHDGYGQRRPGTTYTGTGAGSDSQSYGPVSAAHTLKP